MARLGPEHGFPPTTSAAALGASGDPERTRSAAAQIAQTLLSVGVNLNLAPVVDLNVNPSSPAIGALSRSFSADPAVVTAHARAFVEAHQAPGVLTSLKHFPGHGSATGDTHAGFVDVTATWSAVELAPYRALAPQADSILVGHLFNRHLDPDLPASLSRRIVTGMLREDLGYDGVVLSDDLQMGAITQRWTLEESVRLAVEAGVDVLMFGNNVDSYDPGIGARVHGVLLQLVRDGMVTAERLAASVHRIDALRARVAQR